MIAVYRADPGPARRRRSTSRNIGAFFVTAAFALAVAATIAILYALRAEVTGANVGPKPKRIERDRPVRLKKKKKTT